MFCLLGICLLFRFVSLFVDVFLFNVIKCIWKHLVGVCTSYSSGFKVSYFDLIRLESKTQAPIQFNILQKFQSNEKGSWGKSKHKELLLMLYTSPCITGLHTNHGRFGIKHNHYRYTHSTCGHCPHVFISYACLGFPEFALVSLA